MMTPEERKAAFSAWRFDDATAAEKWIPKMLAHIDEQERLLKLYEDCNKTQAKTIAEQERLLRGLECCNEMHSPREACEQMERIKAFLGD